MSSESGFQDSQFSGSSNNQRTKVDVLNWRENGESKDSECNLRMSLAWDTAFFTSPGVLEHEELFTTLKSRNYDNVVNILGKEEHLLLPSQSLEPDANGNVECYTCRKSLAWDNDFFTSEGVLNPLELAIVNNGFKRSENHLLPVIEDEVWRSMESNNTLDSEGSSLTRLEMDLFEDIRASRFELGRPASAEQDGSRTMMKAMPTSTRHSINKHGSKKITREMSKTPKIQLKHVSSSSLKSSNASEQTNSVSKGSAKRASLGEKHAKLRYRSGILESAEESGKLKKPCLRDSFYVIHGSTQSLRSSMSHCSVPTNKSFSFTTSSNIRPRPPSEITIGKSPPNLRRKVNSQGLTTPLTKTKANKVEVESSCQSTPTSSWYGSPSSSTDEWPSELSLSTPATLRSNRRKNSPYSNLRNSCMEKENQGRSINRHRKDHKGDKGDGNNTDTSGILREVKPSGLRMPSPKLGFFDPANMIEFSTIADTKRDRDVAQRTQCTKLRSPTTLPGTETRHRKHGGTLVSSVSATNGNRSPRTVQCCSNRSTKAEKIIRKISREDNKENEFSFVDCQIESLVKKVNSIDLNNNVVVHLVD